MNLSISKNLVVFLSILFFTACTVQDRNLPQASKENKTQKSEVLKQTQVKTPHAEAEQIAKSKVTDEDLKEKGTTSQDDSKATADVVVPETSRISEQQAEEEKSVDTHKNITQEINPAISLCEEIGSKLGSVSIEECLSQNLVHSSFSAESRSLAYKDFPPLEDREPMGRILVIGGIHGDEFSSVSMLFRWMGLLNQYHSGMFHWRFVPSSNPDGLLKKKSQRQNINGVDLNRNFPTAGWEDQALSHWEKDSLKNPRRYPGPRSASEPETQWIVNQIESFKPDVIISMHAPYHLVDYDGPPKAPNSLGSLYLRKLGVFPGSLGNYAGIDLEMPIVTVELESAGIMPNNKEINKMWRDLIAWLQSQLSGAHAD